MYLNFFKVISVSLCVCSLLTMKIRSLIIEFLLKWITWNRFSSVLSLLSSWLLKSSATRELYVCQQGSLSKCSDFSRVLGADHWSRCCFCWDFVSWECLCCCLEYKTDVPAFREVQQDLNINQSGWVVLNLITWPWKTNKKPHMLFSYVLIASSFILLFEYFRKQYLCRDIPFPDVRISSKAVKNERLEVFWI